MLIARMFGPFASIEREKWEIDSSVPFSMTIPAWKGKVVGGMGKGDGIESSHSHVWLDP